PSSPCAPWMSTPAGAALISCVFAMRPETAALKFALRGPEFRKTTYGDQNFVDPCSGAPGERLALCRDARRAGDCDQAPEEQVHAGAGRADRNGRRQGSAAAVSDHPGRENQQVPLEAWRSSRCRRAAGAEESGVPVLVHTGEPERDQRLCASWRTMFVHRG